MFTRECHMRGPNKHTQKGKRSHENPLLQAGEANRQQRTGMSGSAGCVVAISHGTIWNPKTHTKKEPGIGCWKRGKSIKQMCTRASGPAGWPIGYSMITPQVRPKHTCLKRSHENRLFHMGDHVAEVNKPQRRMSGTTGCLVTIPHGTTMESQKYTTKSNPAIPTRSGEKEPDDTALECQGAAWQRLSEELLNSLTADL